MLGADDGAGICGFLWPICSRLVPCNSSDNSCLQSNMICVEHPQCDDRPLCYPVTMMKENICPPMENKINLKWKLDFSIVAGGNGFGYDLNQVSLVQGIYIDDDKQTMYITQYNSDRIVGWKFGEESGEIVAGGNGQGNEINQLNNPSDVAVDKKNDLLIICDQGNERVVQWSRQNQIDPKIIIPKIKCNGVTIDNNGDVYVSEGETHSVIRLKQGETKATTVAGGNGHGYEPNQLSNPAYIFIDEQYSIYVSDHEYGRVTKWIKNAKEGIIVTKQTIPENVFDYLDVKDIYFGFFYLNNRFQNLYLNSDIGYQLNLSNISKRDFESYHHHVLKPNHDRIKILHLSNPVTIDLIFSSAHLIINFIQIEKLILDNISSKYLINILKYLIHLPQLYSLNLSIIDHIDNLSPIFLHIFCLTKLKSCQLTYQVEEDLLIDFTQLEQSSIEYLIINSHFRYESLQEFLLCLPKLRHLSMNSLIGSNHSSKIEFAPIELKDLKSISLELYSIHFHQLKNLITNCFKHIEKLSITTFNDSTYLSGKQWQQIISFSLPNLHIFDLQNNYNSMWNKFVYAWLSTDFQSSFWKDKQWFSQHCYDGELKSNNGIFFSTDPYRRKDYQFYSHGDHNRTNSNMKQDDFKTVHNLFLHDAPNGNEPACYFPNFELLAALCSISEDAVSQALLDIQNNQLVTAELLEEEDIKSQVKAMVELFQATAHVQVNSFLQFVQVMYRSNALVSAFGTNAVVQIGTYKVYITSTFQVNPNTSLGLVLNALSCTERTMVVPALFYAQPFDTTVFDHINWPIYYTGGSAHTKISGSVNGFFGGCFPLDSILNSTLDCLYNFQCLQILFDYFPALNQV
ncbi:unnamed protein product [Adineta steineri]|nr:unnamed protein product [Adineta steineri]